MRGSVEPEVDAACAAASVIAVSPSVLLQGEEFKITISWELLKRTNRDQFRRVTGHQLRRLHEEMLAMWDETHRS